MSPLFSTGVNMTTDREQKLDEALEESFPASDPLPFGQQEDDLLEAEDLELKKAHKKPKASKKNKSP